MPEIEIADNETESIAVAGKTTVHVRNDADSTGKVQVHIVGIHEDDGSDDDLLAPGESGVYRGGFNGITSMALKAVDGSVTVRWGSAATKNNRSD